MQRAILGRNGHTGSCPSVPGVSVSERTRSARTSFVLSHTAQRVHSGHVQSYENRSSGGLSSSMQLRCTVPPSAPPPPPLSSTHRRGRTRRTRAGPPSRRTCSPARGARTRCTRSLRGSARSGARPLRSGSRAPCAARTGRPAASAAPPARASIRGRGQSAAARAPAGPRRSTRPPAGGTWAPASRSGSGRAARSACTCVYAPWFTRAA
jgi:hypothetical protein